jgi:hypothetical protein
LVENLKKRINHYKKIEADHPGSFVITMTDEPTCGPHIVGDNRYAFWFFGGNRALAISHVSVNLCEMVSRVYQGWGQQPMSADQMIQELGLQ